MVINGGMDMDVCQTANCQSNFPGMYTMIFHWPHKFLEGQRSDNMMFQEKCLYLILVLGPEAID